FGQRGSRDDRRKNPRTGRGIPRAQRPEKGRHQGMDFAPRRSAAARKRRNGTRLVQVRHTAFVGHPWQRWEPFQRHDSVHSSGVAGETAASKRRICRRRRVWSRFQRGIPPTAMGLSVYLYLALLAAVGVLRLVELRISRRHQERMLTQGAVRVIRSSTRRSTRSEEHTSELQSRFDLVCRLLLEKKNSSLGAVS